MRLERRFEDIDAGDRLEIEVHQHDVELAAAYDLERLIAAPDEGDVVPIELEHARTPLPQRPVVIDDEDPDVGLHRRRNREWIAPDAGRGGCHVYWRRG